MATLVPRDEYTPDDYDLGDTAWFKLESADQPDVSLKWCKGVIARVYNTRSHYHIEYGGERYLVEAHELSRTNPDE